jgi:hypothetical protein
MKKKLDQKLIFVPALITCGRAKERASSWAFIGEPKNVEEHRLGTIFLVGEVDAEEENGVSSILPLVGSQLKQEYYAEPRRRALKSFSESLRKGNLIFAQVPKKRNPMWLGKVHLASGALTESTLLFSLVGKIQAFLFRGGATTDLKRRFIQEGRPHPTKLFRHVASGALVAGDRLLFATPRAFNSLFLEDIRHIVREAPLADISRQVEMLYAKEDPHAPLAIVVMEVRLGGNAPAEAGNAAPSPVPLSFGITPGLRTRGASTRAYHKALLVKVVKRAAFLTSMLVNAIRAETPRVIYYSRKEIAGYSSWLLKITQNARAARVLVLLAITVFFLLLLLFRREVMF